MKNIKNTLLTIFAKVVIHGPRIFPIVFYCSFLALFCIHLIYMLITDFVATATGFGFAFGFLLVLFGGMYLVHKVQIWTTRLHDKIDTQKQKLKTWAQNYLDHNVND